jgi:hypothetical protein
MTARRRPIDARPALPRRLLGEADAAAYLGIGATNLRGLGLPRRVLGTRRLYDVADLDAFADGLPYEGEAGGNTCDQVWGVG